MTGPNLKGHRLGARCIDEIKKLFARYKEQESNPSNLHEVFDSDPKKVKEKRLKFCREKLKSKFRTVKILEADERCLVLYVLCST